MKLKDYYGVNVGLLGLISCKGCILYSVTFLPVSQPKWLFLWLTWVTWTTYRMCALKSIPGQLEEAKRHMERRTSQYRCHICKVPQLSEGDAVMLIKLSFDSQHASPLSFQFFDFISLGWKVLWNQICNCHCFFKQKGERLGRLLDAWRWVPSKVNRLIAFLLHCCLHLHAPLPLIRPCSFHNMGGINQKQKWCPLTLFFSAASSLQLMKFNRFDSAWP